MSPFASGRGRFIIRKIIFAWAQIKNECSVCCRRELLKILSANAFYESYDP